MSADEPLLRVRDLHVEFRADRKATRSIVSGVDLDLDRGETIAIVGESGSGKSLTARAIMGLLPRGVYASGTVHFKGQDILSMRERQRAALRGIRLGMLLQDPFTMLNPLLRCGRHIEEVLPRRVDRKAETLRRLAEVGIDDPDVPDRYPFQLSGGMRQRVAIAATLAGDPELLIADEPSTALDVTTQAEILTLLKSVQTARGMALVLITHDLRVAFSVCDRVYVLYAGSLLEVAPAEALEREPLHPYTLGLLLSEPPVDRRLSRFVAIDGVVPLADEVEGTCAFAPRCAWVKEQCVAGKPSLISVGEERSSACIRIDEIRAELQAQRGIEREHAPPQVRDLPPDPLVRVESLVKTFRGRGVVEVQALRGVTLHVGRGESVGLVGESGSGKTTLGRCLVGLETATTGRIEVDGLDASAFASVSRETRARLRRTVQIVFQDPYSSLDPMQSVGRTLREILLVNDCPANRVAGRVGELLEHVGLPPGYAARRPSSLSGGERQRVAIARTLAVEPSLLVCDEPVSALDVSVQAQILNLFRSLRETLGLSYLFITHDLAVVRQVVERVYVLYRGEIVEEGPVDDVLDKPQHEYTQRLVASIPKGSDAAAAFTH